MTDSDISDDGSDLDCYKCSYCREKIQETDEEHEYFCNECANTDIIIWKCNRCTNIYSPDYCDESIYSDCCLIMAEGNYTNDDIYYCDISGDTMYKDEKCCYTCSNDSDNEDEQKCIILKAYERGKCKLKDY
jgi:hypothetical protein